MSNHHIPSCNLVAPSVSIHPPIRHSWRREVLILLIPVLTASALHAFTTAYVANSNPGNFSASAVKNTGYTYTEYSGPFQYNISLQRCGWYKDSANWTHMHTNVNNNYYLNSYTWTPSLFQLGYVSIENSYGNARGEVNSY
jgi:hypothetical protein